MKNEIKTNHAFCMHCLPRAIFDFVLFSSQGPKSSTMRGLVALAPSWCMCNIDLLLFCDFVAEIYKKKKETNGIKFKRCGFDKID